VKKTSIIAVAMFFAATAMSQRLPAGAEVVQKIVRGTEGVQDYTVDLLIDVNMERIRIPRAKATMYFKKPDKVHFDSPSIAMLPREGMAFNSSAVLEQYTAQTLGPDTVNGKKVIKIQLAAREASARLRQVFAWVDQDTWTISRMQTIPYEGRLLTIDFVYGLQDNKYWLPTSLALRYSVLNESGMKREEQPPTTPDTPLDQMRARAPRSACRTKSSSPGKRSSKLY
jgi:outer membrane lipoprotein-sorting protein